MPNVNVVYKNTVLYLPTDKMLVALSNVNTLSTFKLAYCRETQQIIEFSPVLVVQLKANVSIFSVIIMHIVLMLSGVQNM